MNTLCETVRRAAFRSLYWEAHATPKPGLVDESNNGAHADMNLTLLEKSASAIAPFIGNAAQIGCAQARMPSGQCFLPLKLEGLRAETAMLRATNGVNTHKGAVFCLTLLAGAYGRLYFCSRPVSPEAVCFEAGRICKDVMEQRLSLSTPVTNGERAYLQNGMGGARGEAASGYPSLRNTALPVFRKALPAHGSVNSAAVRTLIHLIALSEDTCVYARGGAQGLALSKSLSASLIDAFGDASDESFFRAVRDMDSAFIRFNLSPGGCADLLAATLFLLTLSGELKEECL